MLVKVQYDQRRKIDKRKLYQQYLSRASNQAHCLFLPIWSNEIYSVIQFMGKICYQIKFLTMPWHYVRLEHMIPWHYTDVIICAMASQITSPKIVYSTVCSGWDKRKHQSSASLTFVMVIHRSPANSTHKGPVSRKMFPFDDVIMHNDNPTSPFHWKQIESINTLWPKPKIKKTRFFLI